MTTSNALKNLAFHWFAEGRHSLHDRMEFRKKHHVGTQRMKALEIEYEIWIKDKAKRDVGVRRAQAGLYKELQRETPEEAEEADADLERDTEEVLIKLRELGEHGNAQALQIWLKAQGKLVEKQEITHKIDGSIIAKAIIEAIRKLRESGYRVVDVQNVAPILRTEVLLSAGQGETNQS